MLGPNYFSLTRSISWLLMPWLLASPGHQQPFQNVSHSYQVSEWVIKFYGLSRTAIHIKFWANFQHFKTIPVPSMEPSTVDFMASIFVSEQLAWVVSLTAGSAVKLRDLALGTGDGSASRKSRHRTSSNAACDLRWARAAAICLARDPLAIPKR